MRTLDKKYWFNSLSVDELLEYRKRLDDEPLQETERRICEEWAEMDVSGDESWLTGHDFMRIKRRIESSIRRRPAFLKPSVLLSIAASLLIMFFMGTTASLLNEKRSVEANEVLISTASGEMSHVSLPDGTVVSLNEESSLSYKSVLFNRKKREISFKGEGYFDVARNEEHPFIINAGSMKVEVLGTKFLLIGRDNLCQAELVLDEGKVRLQSNMADCTVTLVNGQKAALDFSSGMISVTSADRQGLSAFTHKSLDFTDMPFASILEALSSAYDVEIQVKGICPEDHFTGSLPLSDLSMALEILSKVYNLDVSLSGGTFWFSARR